MIDACARPSASARIGKIIDSNAGRLELIKILGEGAYGVVYYAVDQQTATALSSSSSSSSTKPLRREYAVKVLRKAPIYTMEGQCQSREIVTHKIATGHANVLTLHDVLEDEGQIYLVLDYCPGGDLYSAIVEDRVFARNNALVKDVFVQIVDAVQSLHDKGIYHRDLKPDNIFVGADGKTVFLGDFGLATDQAMSTNFSCGSSYYMSPECIGEEHSFHAYSTQKSDIWSLGVILTNMISGRNPWRYATTNDENFHRYMSAGDALRESLPISLAACDLLQRIFTFRASDRITLPELRTAIMEIDEFFLTEGQLATSTEAIKSAAAGYTPKIPQPKTPELPVKSTFDCMHSYPDEEYLFNSPNPDSDSPMSSASSSTTSSSSSYVSSAYSSTSCFAQEDIISTKGKSREVVSGDPSEGISPFGAAAKRLFERLMI